MPKKIIIKLEGYDHISDSEKILGEKKVPATFLLISLVACSPSSQEVQSSQPTEDLSKSVEQTVDAFILAQTQTHEANLTLTPPATITSSPSPTSTQSPTPDLSASPTLSPTPSQTPTPSVIWADNWFISVGPEPLTQYTMLLVHIGNSLSGTFNAGGDNIVTISGRLNTNYMQVVGTWSSTSGASGTFEWLRQADSHLFVGNLDNGSEAWCGARAGQSIPNPCFGPENP